MHKLRLAKHLILSLTVFFFAIHSSKSSNDKPMGSFWQITDIHWDIEYSESGNKLEMCHNSSNASQILGHFGDYLCDSPFALVKSALAAMREFEPNPNFILWTGDNAPHTDGADFTEIFTSIPNVTNEIISIFGVKVPLVPVLGNHDAFPKNDFPASANAFYERYLTEGNWAKVIPEEGQDDFKTGGYYRKSISPALSIFVLNTNLYYRGNGIGEGLEDPSGQLAWMRRQLSDAKQKKQKVLIAGHAPPGFWERNAVEPFFNDTYNDAFSGILNEFSEVIMAQVYGHTHTDSFRIFSQAKDKLNSVAFIAPSLTPWFPISITGGTAINPSLRLYSYDDDAVQDYIQYQFNLTEANNNATFSSCPVRIGSDVAPNDAECSQSEVMDATFWRVYYRATEAFRVKSLTVDEMASVVGQLRTNDTMFQEYFRRNSAGVSHGLCNSTCKLTQLCAIANIQISEMIACKQVPNPVPIPITLPTIPSTSATHDSIATETPSSHSAISPDDSSDSAGSSYWVTIMSIGILVGVVVGVMLLIVGVRRRKLLTAGPSWGTTAAGYRPLSSLEHD